MKKKILMIALGFVVTGAIYAQEYKLSKSAGTLEIREVNNVSIEGHAGSEIIFSSRGHDRDDDGRAKGLRAISSMGLEDNTGIGLSVVDKGEVIMVQQLKKTDGPDITIKVPKGVKISYSHTSPYGDEIEIKNFEGEIEVSTVHNGVVLTNTTGPMEVKTVHGDIEASLGAALKSRVSIVSVHGHVDVALPVATKANLRMGTTWGEIMVDPDFKIEIENTGGMVKYSDKVRGKLNGGGTEIELNSTHNNVYLRKK
jgi:predicted membrane protein